MLYKLLFYFKQREVSKLFHSISQQYFLGITLLDWTFKKVLRYSIHTVNWMRWICLKQLMNFQVCLSPCNYCPDHDTEQFQHCWNSFPVSTTLADLTAILTFVTIDCYCLAFNFIASTYMTNFWILTLYPITCSSHLVVPVTFCRFFGIFLYRQSCHLHVNRDSFIWFFTPQAYLVLLRFASKSEN